MPGAGWWSSRYVVLIGILACAIPLIGPAIPPLTDVPGHIGRYFIMLHGDTSLMLATSYRFDWQLIGNLGADLVVWMLGHVLPVEVATKLTVLGIMLLNAGGMLALAREVHGRVPPTAWLALPLAYAFPFQFGFLNYVLAIALSFWALVLWLRLGRLGRLKLRAIVFVPIAFALFVAHVSGWGVFGLMAFAAEFARLRGEGQSWHVAGRRAILACLPLIPPVAIALVGPGDPHAQTYDWFNWGAKLQWLVSILRERHETYDLLSALFLFAALFLGARRLGMRAVLALPAIACLVAFVLLPRVLMNGTSADMRLAPVALALALLAIRPPAHRRTAQAIAIVAIGFLALRLAVTTMVFGEIAERQQHELAALAAIPDGASVLALVDRPCDQWATPRTEHLPSLLIPRRHAFVNSQWAIYGQQLLSVRRADVGPFAEDPSQIVGPPQCDYVTTTRLPDAVARFNRSAFTHVWTIGIPARALSRDLRPIWSDGRSAVYAVAQPKPVSYRPRP